MNFRFSGVSAFNFYAVPIFQVSFGSFNPHLAAVATGSVQLLASSASGILCDTVGRLPILVLSTVLMSGALAGFGFYSFYQARIKYSYDIQSLLVQWSVYFENSL